ncbi:hypothetical protein DRP04_14835 [Archaeoglobales archaeon]|nr:MAG: hypothetical protein DRP04_14835 [Archaeoglobales archaeon]
MSGKGRRKGGIRIYLKGVFERLNAGLLPSEVKDVPKSTLYDLLNLLKECRLVYEDEDGKYYFAWRKERKEIEEKWKKEREEILNRFFYPFAPQDYERKLEHCKNLFEIEGKFVLDSPAGIESFVWRMLEEEKEELRSSPRKYFLQHIKSGYPEIYKLYERWKELLKEVDEAWKAFSQEVNERAAKKFTVSEKPREDEKVVWQLSQAVEKCIHLRRVDVREEGGFVWVYNLTVSKDESIIKDLEEFIRGCIESEPGELYRKYSELLAQRDSTFVRLKYSIESLAVDVKHRRVLEGHCEKCPPVTILNLKNLVLV